MSARELAAEKSWHGGRHEVVMDATAALARRANAAARWEAMTVTVGVVIVAIVVLACATSPLLGMPAPDHQNLLITLQPPSLSHPFGTDALGRDVLSRTLHGGRIDLTVGLIITYVPMVIGILIGGLAGYFGGAIESTIMRVADFVIAFPFLVLALAVTAIMGAGLGGLYVAFLVVGWALYARLTRAEMLVLRERQFILAAQTLGLPTRRILWRHALPNVLAPNLVFSIVDLVLNITFLASASYLGLGVQPPTAEWGAIIADGQTNLLTAWWVSTLPGLVIVFFGVGLSLVGDGLAARLGHNIEIVR